LRIVRKVEEQRPVQLLCKVCRACRGKTGSSTPQIVCTIRSARNDIGLGVGRLCSLPNSLLFRVCSLPNSMSFRTASAVRNLLLCTGDSSILCDAGHSLVSGGRGTNVTMSHARRYFVYMMSSKSRTLYVGVTGSLIARVFRHKAGEGGGFTRKYRVNRLVWYQSFEHVGNAIARETEIKAWRREKKLALIFEKNPTWEDIAADWGKQVALQYAPPECDKQVPHG